MSAAAEANVLAHASPSATINASSCRLDVGSACFERRRHEIEHPPRIEKLTCRLKTMIWGKRWPRQSLPPHVLRLDQDRRFVRWAALARCLAAQVQSIGACKSLRQSLGVHDGPRGQTKSLCSNCSRDTWRSRSLTS